LRIIQLIVLQFQLPLVGSETVQVTPLRRTLAFLPNPNALVVVNIGMQAVKLGYVAPTICALSYLGVLANASRFV